MPSLEYRNTSANASTWNHTVSVNGSRELSVSLKRFVRLRYNIMFVSMFVVAGVWLFALLPVCSFLYARRHISRKTRKHSVLMTRPMEAAANVDGQVLEQVAVELEETSLTTDGLAFSNRIYGFGEGDLDENDPGRSTAADPDQVVY